MLIARHPDALNIPGYTHPQVSPFVPTLLLGVSGLVLAAVLGSFYLTRTRDVTAEGKKWTAGYFSLETPPQAAQAQTIRPDAHGGLVMAVLIIFAGFLVTLFWENQQGQAAVQAYKQNEAARLITQPVMPSGDAVPVPMPQGPGPAAKGKGKGAKAKFGKARPDMGPLTEKSQGTKRPTRPAFDDAEAAKGADAAEPTKETPPESLEADPLPPARQPTL
jgi:hypothetical protein